VGKRMSIKTTRSCINAILDGTADESQYTEDSVFGFHIPVTLNGVDSHLLNPRNAWADKVLYDSTAKKLAGMFRKNFQKFVGHGSIDYTQYWPKE